MHHADLLKNPYFLMNDYKELNSKYGYYGGYKAKYGNSAYSNNYYSDEEGESKKKGFLASLFKRFN